VRSPLNLASRPARNERLPSLSFGLAAGLLLVVTIAHGLGVARLASTAATSLDQEVERLLREREELRVKDRTLRAVKVEKASIERWGAVKNLVDQRAFSWTGLLSRLEAVLPADVRLESIAPTARTGRFVLALEAVVRSADDAVPLVKAFEDRPEFEEVFLVQIDEGASEVSCRYEMVYRPEAIAPSAAGEAVARADSPEVGP
jgi:Tfp pilus assembly protein PilN